MDCVSCRNGTGEISPSLTSVIGIRTASGFEIGVGPNLSFAGVGMILGFGKNFKSGDLNIPVNLVLVLEDN